MSLPAKEEATPLVGRMIGLRPIELPSYGRPPEVMPRRITIAIRCEVNGGSWRRHERHGLRGGQNRREEEQQCREVHG